MMIEEHQAIIFYLAQIYGIPIYTDDSGGMRVDNIIVKEAIIWANQNLEGKTKNELNNFKNCIQDGFLSTSNRPFPLRRDLNQAYEVCFLGIRQMRYQTKEILSGIKLEIDYNAVRDVQPEPFDFLKYLRKEAALRLTSPKIAYDILFKMYGMEGVTKISKWKGEYNYDNCIETTQSGKVDWIEVYKEHPPKEATR